MNFIVWIIAGIVAGWLAGLVVRGRGFGLIGDLVIGLLGGLVGGWIAGLVGLQTTSFLGQILVAALKSINLVAIIRFLKPA